MAHAIPSVSATAQDGTLPEPHPQAQTETDELSDAQLQAVSGGGHSVPFSLASNVLNPD